MLVFISLSTAGPLKDLTVLFPNCWPCITYHFSSKFCLSLVLCILSCVFSDWNVLLSIFSFAKCVIYFLVHSSCWHGESSSEGSAPSFPKLRSICLASPPGKPRCVLNPGGLSLVGNFQRTRSVRSRCVTAEKYPYILSPLKYRGLSPPPLRA